jgi:hypothetical protein
MNILTQNPYWTLAILFIAFCSLMALAYFSEWYHSKKEREMKEKVKKVGPIYRSWEDR